MPTRRELLISSLLASSHLLPSTQLLASDAQTTTTRLTSLDKDIIQHVNRLLSGKKIKLTLLYPQGSLANIEPVVARFVKETTVDIKLKEVGVNDINSNILFKTALDDSYFDIALPATFGLPDLVDAGVLKNLNNYAKKYEPTDYKRYQLYDDGDYVDNNFYGYQTDGDTYLMFYNKNFIEDKNNQKAFIKEYGYALAIPTTWEQLDDMICFFHAPNKQQYGGCLFRVPGYGAWEWWSRFHAKGYFPLDDKLTPQINNKAGIAALQEMLNVSKHLHPKVGSDGLFDNWETFSKGQTFCNIGWGGTQKHLNSSESLVKGQLLFGPTPGGTVAGSEISCPIFNWGWNYVVSAQCPHPEVAYLFTLFACSPVMSSLALEKDGFFDPFREEHYANAAIQKAYTKEFLEAHKTSMKESIPDFYLHNQGAYLASLQENIYLAYKGSLTAKQALDITATKWKLLTREVGYAKQKKTWLKLKAKYPPALQQILQ